MYAVGLPRAYADPLAIEIDREFPPVVCLPNPDASFDWRKVGLAVHGTYMLHEEYMRPGFLEQMKIFEL